MDIKKEINNFITIADSLINSVNAIQSVSYENHYKKILYFSLMEMLCKAVYGNKFKNQHRKKVISFINDFCSWEHAQHVSLPQLVLFLKKECPAELVNLKEYTFDLIGKWPTYKPIYLSFDPHFKELRELWPGVIKINNQKMTLDHFRHDNLLYTLRNSFVHENRSLGFDFTLFDNIEEPYYTSRMAIVKSANGKESEVRHVAFELSHPVDFFKTLLLNALPKMEGFLLEQSLNPYDNFTISSEWISLID